MDAVSAYIEAKRGGYNKDFNTFSNEYQKEYFRLYFDNLYNGSGGGSLSMTFNYHTWRKSNSYDVANFVVTVGEQKIPHSVTIDVGNFGSNNNQFRLGTNDFPGGSFLSNSNIYVTFDPNASNMINPSLSKYFGKIMTKAYREGINAINISSTTVHPSNATRTAHTIENGARALDINYINGVHVSTDNNFTDVLQNIINSTPGYLENYGPLIINKVINDIEIPAPWARNIPGGHYDHIHLSVPK